MDAGSAAGKLADGGVPGMLQKHKQGPLRNIWEGFLEEVISKLSPLFLSGEEFML